MPARASVLISRHALLVIVVAAATVRVAMLDTQSYWYDEAATVDLIGNGFGDMLGKLDSREGTPPLYYVLAWPWAKLFGTSELGLRSLSALFGTATVPVLYAAARVLATRRAALIAGALAAVNPLLIWYSQEARSYALLVLLSALSFLYFVLALRDPRKRWLWLWALTSSLALASHYFAFFLVAPEALALLVAARRRWREVALPLVAVAAAGLALLPLALAQEGRLSWIDGIDLSERLAQVPQHFLLGLSVPWGWLPPLAGALVLAVALYGLRRGDDRDRRAIEIAGGVAIAGAVLVLVAIAAGSDFLLSRNAIELWIPLGVAAGAALGARAIGRLGMWTTVALCMISLALVVWTAGTRGAQRVDWRGLAGAMGEPDQPRLVVGGQLGTVTLRIFRDASSIPPRGRPVVVSELALLSLRPVSHYNVGPCWWGSLCGASGRPPPIQAPAPFELTAKGETSSFRYRLYRAPREVRVPVRLEYSAFYVLEDAG
jgi:mannosyltransferase